jgi:hypothetical protein
MRPQGMTVYLLIRNGRRGTSFEFFLIKGTVSNTDVFNTLRGLFLLCDGPLL